MIVSAKDQDSASCILIFDSYYQPQYRYRASNHPPNHNIVLQFLEPNWTWRKLYMGCYHIGNRRGFQIQFPIITSIKATTSMKNT